MFKQELCKLCGDCLVKCQWIEVDRKQAIEWRKALAAGQHTPVLDNCITCFACNEFCVEGANPCDGIMELQEKYGTLVSKDVVETTKASYLFTGDLKDLPKAKRIMTACSYKKSDPHFFDGQLYSLPIVGGKPYLCWAIFPHLGATSVQKKQLQTLVDRLALTGAEEVVCFHVDCYTALASLAPDAGIDVPFKPIHFAEYGLEVLGKNISRIRPLNLNIAYQRPCTTRYTSDKEHLIDDLFKLVGVNRVEREYDREQALCCTSPTLLYNKEDRKKDRDKNILDARKAGAKAMVYFCPVCRNMLSDSCNEHSLPLIFLGDLVRAALGEITLPV